MTDTEFKPVDLGTLPERVFQQILDGWVHNHTGMRLLPNTKAVRRKRRAAKLARRANR